MRTLVWLLLRALVALRYRVRVKGVEEIVRRGTAGVLFLPNHPALIDPVLIMLVLYRRFQPRPLADRDQMARWPGSWLMRLVRARPVPDVKQHGQQAVSEVEEVLRDCARGLRDGENILFYPSGHLYRSRYENLRANIGVKLLREEAPEARVVLVRTRGIWGSAFSMADGQYPDVPRILLFGLWVVLANLVFFVPKREVTLELYEPEELPLERAAANERMEAWYNEDAPPALHIPYFWWRGREPREMSDPQIGRGSGDLSRVPESTRNAVAAHLRETAGVEAVEPDQRLDADLGLDSLKRTELAIWLEREFGHSTPDQDALQTVADVMLAAHGEAVVTRVVELKPVPRKWRTSGGRQRLRVPTGGTITGLLLAQARRTPRRAIVADNLRGVRSYRELIAAIYALRPAVEVLPGDCVGVMLPAGVAATSTYLTCLFAGKTPVMLNWTTGAANLEHALEVTGARRIITSSQLVARLEGQGFDLERLKPQFVALEDVASELSLWRKLSAAAHARLSWKALRTAAVPDVAAVLMTSGSETRPKAVPLTHENILTNVRDIAQLAAFHRDDALIGFLPPFHSFGLTVTVCLPLVLGLRCVYHANPNEAWVIARLIERYGVTMLVGTPTFLAGILRTASTEQMQTLRFAVTGAERCPESTYQALEDTCAQAEILEGYGVTECSPIVSVNRPGDSRKFTIGKPLPSVEVALVGPESGKAVERGEKGMLLVRGPSVFGGYWSEHDAPFVELDGKQWYRTGDLVREDEDGHLVFVGRLKRFVKRGGEMISLPAIESALLERFMCDEQDAESGPPLAVVATPEEAGSEIVLFTTKEISRAEANQQVRDAGLSALHNIARVEQVEEIPQLGTGKTDYRALSAELQRRRDRATLQS